MKNKINLLICTLSILLLTGCATISDQVKSRELLAKCKYDLKKVEVENLDFDQIIRLASSAKEINFKKPSKDLIPLLKEIKDLKFDLNFSTLDFVSTMSVTNPNPHEVILDSLFFDAYLDETYVVQAIHDGTLNIPANSEGEMRLLFSMPTDFKLKKILDAENMVLKGKVWLKLELIKGLPITVPFPFNVKQKVPREQIQKAIDAQKEKVKKRIIKELGGGKIKDILNRY